MNDFTHRLKATEIEKYFAMHLSNRNVVINWATRWSQKFHLHLAVSSAVSLPLFLLESTSLSL